MIRLLALFLLLPSLAWAQSSNFNPNNNPVVNQAYSATAISPSDTATFAVTRGIYTNGDGAGNSCTLVIRFNGNSSTVTMSGIQIGYPYPFQAIQIKSSGTTCTGIFALR